MATLYTPEYIPTRIIICCDGTANSEYLGIRQSPLTNVSRISRCIQPRSARGGRQLVLYIPGIGTNANNPTNILNQATGKGLDEKIKEAYSFICHNYNWEDEIILIGFSRGAFTVRCLVDLIGKVGLFTKAELIYLHDTYSRWKEDADIPKEGRRGIRIKVCAVWDTVGSIGAPWPGFFGLNRPGSPRFVHSDLSGIIDNAFQALSLHEHRYHFNPLVWRRGPDAAAVRLEQCWFMGFHSDIGGGNEKESLAHFALAWMIGKLQDFVDFDDTSLWTPSLGGPTWRLELSQLEVRDSMTKRFFAGGSFYRRPRCQFWGHLGHEEQPAVGTDPLQKMHSTVRFLARNRLLEQEPKSLRGILVPNRTATGTWFWDLRFRSSDYQVQEDMVVAEERELLMRWLAGEHKALLRQQFAGADPPRTIINMFREWLETGDYAIAP